MVESRFGKNLDVTCCTVKLFYFNVIICCTRCLKDPGETIEDRQYEIEYKLIKKLRFEFTLRLNFYIIGHCVQIFLQKYFCPNISPDIWRSENDHLWFSNIHRITRKSVKDVPIDLCKKKKRKKNLSKIELFGSEDHIFKTHFE